MDNLNHVHQDGHVKQDDRRSEGVKQQNSKKAFQKNVQSWGIEGIHVFFYPS